MMDPRYEAVKTYLVEKFYPPRCPKCEHAFKSVEDFGLFVGNNNPAKSYASAAGNWMKRWPEIWQPEIPGPDHPFGKTGKVVGFSGNPYGFDFITCSQCRNVTLRIKHASRNVMSREEAERLVEKEGFTCILETLASGHMAQPYSQLEWLAKMDLLMLEYAVNAGRENASLEKDEWIAGDIFAATVYKPLNEIMKKNSEAAQYNQTLGELQNIFGINWETLDPDAGDSLITADLIYGQLSSQAEASKSVDFAPVVLSYSRALERTLLVKVFNKFKGSSFSKQFSPLNGKKNIDKSIEALQRFVTGQQEITLGNMAFCIMNLGGKIRKNDGNGFAQFIMDQNGDLDTFIDVDEFPSRLNKFVDTFRNKSAHVTRISKQVCDEARSYLLDEPIKLLLQVERRFNKS